MRFIALLFTSLWRNPGRFNGHMAELVDALVSGTSGSNTLEVRVFLCPPRIGVVAQLIERYVRIVEVVGLSPISSTKIFMWPRNVALYLEVTGDMAEW